ncbi:MAG: biopolymer transporter ExbD, partial [Caulobacteraceae bacterium]
MAAKVGGGGKGKYNLGNNADMNVTPFVDVMLVLLIIFMVSAPLATLAIKVDLPPAVPTDTPPKDPTYISLLKTGQMTISGRLTSLPTLDRDLTAKFNVANPKNEVILIRADRDVRYGTFMGVVNQLQTDGYYKVA